MSRGFAETIAAQDGMREWTEEERLVALRRARLLDTEAESEFDELARLAAQVCESPVALVSLVDAGRQWFKARVGIDLRETPIEQSVCRHAIRQTDLFVVPDLISDGRFADNGLVVAGPRFRFYAGARLDTPDGLPLGTLCVLDFTPRPQGLSDEQRRMLAALAEATMRKIEQRMGRDALIASERQIRRLVDDVPQFIWSARGDGAVDFANRPFREFLGREETYGPIDNWLDLLHPDDRQSTLAAWTRCIADGSSYEVEHRIRDHDGEYRWMLVRATPVRDAEGRVERWFGSSTDIHEKKLVNRRCGSARSVIVSPRPPPPISSGTPI